MASIQNFNVFKYVRDYVSPLLRKPRLLAYLQALATPLQQWRDSRTDVVYPDLERRARYNAQVARFEAALNILFGVTTTPTFRGIYLTDGSSKQRTYVFSHAENIPLPIYPATAGKPVYLFNHVELLPTVDFIVHVPVALYNTKLPQIKAAVNRYKLAGTTYRVNSY